MTEFKISEVTTAPDAVTVKDTSGRRAGYQLPVIYVLSDGRHVTGLVRGARKRDITANLSDLQQAAVGGLLTAKIDDGGRIVYLSRCFSISSLIEKS